MRELFNVPKETVCRVWHKYMSSTYEELSKPEQTLQDAGLYAGQVSQGWKEGVEGRWEEGSVMKEKWRSGRGEGKERSVMREGRCWRGEEDGRNGWRGEISR